MTFNVAAFMPKYLQKFVRKLRVRVRVGIRVRVKVHTLHIAPLGCESPIIQSYFICQMKSYIQLLI